MPTFRYKTKRQNGSRWVASRRHNDAHRVQSSRVRVTWVSLVVKQDRTLEASTATVASSRVGNRRPESSREAGRRKSRGFPAMTSRAMTSSQRGWFRGGGEVSPDEGIPEIPGDDVTRDDVIAAGVVPRRWWGRSSSAASWRFHLLRRFWNQIFTCNQQTLKLSKLENLHQ